MNILSSIHGLSRSPTLRRSSAVLGLGLAASLAGCGDPPVDSNSPVPTGIVQGNILYVGPRVQCTWTGGAPTAVKGVAILTLQSDSNPLPPEGTATMPVDLKAIGGEDIFVDLWADCMPETGEPNPAAPVIIQRPYGFEWTNIPLGPAMPADGTGLPEDYQTGYRIVATYDQAGDFNPLFDVTQAPNHGDNAGAALENPAAAVPKFFVIRFDSRSVATLGQVRSGVNVTIGATVWTDPALMRVSQGYLSSQQGWGGFTWAYADFPKVGLTLYGRTAGTGDRAALDATLSALKLSSLVNFAEEDRYAWYIEPIDVDRDGDKTCPPASNGTDPDCHPLFGAAPGFGMRSTWQSPVSFLRRVSSPIEVSSGVPDVAFIPGAGQSNTSRRAQYPDLELAVFPVATLTTNPAVPECRMLYFADGTNPSSIGTLATFLPDGTAGECSELPTGYYSVTTLGGYALQSPLQRAAEGDDSISNTGWVINNGNFSSQLWVVPNSLGDWTEVGDDLARGAPEFGPYTCLPPGSVAAETTPICLPEQSLMGAAVIADPDTSNPVGRNDPSGAGTTCSAYASALATNRWADDPARDDDWGDLCCGPIRHLCGLPLCDTIPGGVTQTWSNDPAEQAMNVRGFPTAVTGRTTVTIGGERVERTIPNCVAFPMPSQCCAP